ETADVGVDLVGVDAAQVVRLEKRVEFRHTARSVLGTPPPIPWPGGPPVISVVFPAHNEAPFLEAAVHDVVLGLRDRGRPFEVIVVENGSSDATAAVADRLAAELPEVLTRQWPTPDYGRSLRTGFLAATGDVVVNFDVDYYDLEFLDRALVRLDEPDQPVVVVGTKRGEGAEDTRSWPRKVVTYTFSTILKVGFGLKVSDTHGIKAMRRAPLVPFGEAT